jgi:type II secretory pathway component PulF
MVYPVIVIIVSLGLTFLLSLTFSRFMPNMFDQVMPVSPLAVTGVWFPPAFLALAALIGLAAVSIPSWRASLRWRLPAFREASLAQLASAVTLMLKNGTTLAEALALAESLEAGTPAGKALAQWRSLVETGQGKPTQWPAANPPFPPLFLWLVQNGGEDVASGFQKAAEIYRSRASYRIELALYGALPISILLLGQMVFWQVAPMVQQLIALMNMLGNVSGS